LLLVGTWLLFVPDPGADAISMTVAAIIFYSGWTMLTIPHQAWGAELSGEYDERTRIMASREGFGLVGVILAVTLPVAVEAVVPRDPGESSEARALWLIAVVASVSLPLAGLVLLAVVPEPPARIRAPQGWRAGWSAVRANRPFGRLATSYLLNGIANGLPASLFLLFVEHALGRPDWAGGLLVVYFLAALLGVPLAHRFAKGIGKHRAWSWSMLIACAAFVAAPWLGPEHAWMFVPICIVTGLALGADLVLPPAMQADVVDLDTVKGGPGRAGLFFALWAMITKLAMALAVGLAFPLLSLSGFVVGGGNPPAQLLALGAIYAWLPIAFKLAAVALIWKFPLTASVQAELRARLATPGAWRRA
jgi:Na+/melibiose symporter-like transporter